MTHLVSKSIIFCFWISLLFQLDIAHVQAKRVGSNSQSSRQRFTQFSAHDIEENLMMGFARFAHGFSLEDSKTTVSFNASFPISGDVFLGGGSLHLQTDLIFSNTFHILSPGTIFGYDHTIRFPSSQNKISLLDISSSKDVYELVDSKSTAQRVYNLEWWHDNQYLVCASDTNSKKVDLYYFDGQTITTTASSASLGGRIYSTSTHPFDDYVAIAQYSKSGQEVRIYKWNRNNGTFAETGGAELNRHATAVSWHPSGNYVAVGTLSGTNEVRVYAFEGETLTSVASADLSPNRSVMLDSMSWDVTGSYLAVGNYYSTASDASELVIYHFENEPSLTLTQTEALDVNQGVRSLDWSPTGSFLAVGYYTGSDKLRLYSFDRNKAQLSEHIQARIGQRYNPLSVSWGKDLNYLSIGEQHGSGVGCKVFEVNLTDTTLTLYRSFPTTSHVYATRWSGDGTYLARGDYNKKIYLYKKKNLSELPFVFDDVTLEFNSDMLLNVPMKFRGKCVLHGNGYTFDFGKTSSLIIAKNSQVLIKDVTLKNVVDNIRCLDDSGSISLHNIIWIQDTSSTFSRGSFSIQGLVDIRGESSFVYQSKMTSTIKKNSQLLFDRNMTFSYDPIFIPAKNLLYFEDKSSILALNGATLHATGTGLVLSKGKLLVDDESYLSSERHIRPIYDAYGEETDRSIADVGISFGSAQLVDDFSCYIAGGASLRVKENSTLNNHNIQQSAWRFGNHQSKLCIGQASNFFVYQTMDVDKGEVVLEKNSVLGKASGVALHGSLQIAGRIHKRKL